MKPDVQWKGEDVFAATNESLGSTAVALSLQVCVAAVTGTPRTRQRFLFRKQSKKSTHVFQNKTLTDALEISTEESVHNL